MQIKVLKPDQLLLNPDNDRHGPLKDEASAIQWLLENRDAHMRALAADLVNTQRLYEPPLVRSSDGEYVVFDGNRRMCCIKLLIDPALAPSERWKTFFTELSSKEVVGAFSNIACEVESNLAVIDEMLYRRHTGSQDGIGRSQWDPEGKSFFLQRTGKASVGLGEVIERALKAEQLIPDDTELPWSNLERLFSSEPIRKRAGFSFSGGSLLYLTDKQKTWQHSNALPKTWRTRRWCWEIYGTTPASRDISTTLKVQALTLMSPQKGARHQTRKRTPKMSVQRLRLMSGKVEHRRINT
jgi:hypothetical protein